MTTTASAVAAARRLNICPPTKSGARA
jgi:hypothetical protein